MRNIFAVLIATLVLTGAGCSSLPTAPSQSAAQFDKPVTLSIGKSVTFEDGLKASLTTINDSRCPQGVECIWAGELSPTIHLSGGALTAQSDVILGPISKPSTTVGSYTITLVDVTETTATISVSK